MNARRLIPVTVVALLAGACSDVFLPPSYLHDLRVLAVESTPLEAGPGERVTLRPRLYLPPGESLADARWSFCPYTLGAEAGNRCVDARCESSLAVAGDGSVEAEPVALALSCAAALGLPPGLAAAGAASASSLESVFRGEYRSSAGLARQVVARLPIYPLGAPAARNRPPVIAEVKLGGEVAPLPTGSLTRPVAAGGELEVAVAIDPASLDRYVDEAGRERVEEPILSFFATAGRLDDDRGSGLSSRTTWRATELKAGEERAELYVVARDLRGGQTVAGPLTIAITR